jgi:dTDP-4-amino-4,6-dideoxygalactose transaminase
MGKDVREMMKVPFYGHVRQYHSLKAEIDGAIQAVLESGEYTLGPTLARFERELAEYAGLKYAVGVNSCTDALWLSLMALGVGPGDEVITVANTFFATVEAIWIAGAKPVFVEIEPDTCLIDACRIEAAINPRTKAIMPVHLYGQMADMRAIAAIVRKHGLLLVEDNAQSIDACGPDFFPGELSEAVCTSFLIQKNLGTFGDAGAVLTNREDLAVRIRKLRNHGSLQRGYQSMGYNSRLDDLQAGVLSVKLKKIREWSDRRREIAAMYTAGLNDLGFKLPVEKPGYRHVYHQYEIEVDERDAMLAYLSDAGIDAKTHYPIPIHKQAGYSWGMPADPEPVLPLTEASSARVVSLPMFPELTQEEIDYVIEVCQRWADRAG